MTDGSPSGRVLRFLYILCSYSIPHAVSLQIATFAQGTLTAMAAGDTNTSLFIVL